MDAVPERQVRVCACGGCRSVRFAKHPWSRSAVVSLRAATGQPIGGVAPVGHPAPVRTLVDRALVQYAEVWAAAGIPHSVVPISFADLVKVPGGEPADVA